MCGVTKSPSYYGLRVIYDSLYLVVRVCPESAGVFHKRSNKNGEDIRLPCDCGGFPLSRDKSRPKPAFALRVRGFSCIMYRLSLVPWVCPASAGVFLTAGWPFNSPGCLPCERGGFLLSPNPPKGYGGGVDTGDDGYGKANGPGPVPIDGVEGSGRWPRQWPGGGRQWRRPAKTARRHAGSGTGGLGWHEFAGQPQGLSSGRVGRRRRAVRLAGEWRAIGPGRN